MPERDRDQSVEQLLRRVMSHDVTPLQGACVDSETLAAWSEGSLRGAELSAVERHVADCARCRAMMASFVRTTPPVPVAESLWRRWHLAWAVPLATAATAAAIWVALPDNGAEPLPSAQKTNALDERSTALSSETAADSAPPAASAQAGASAIRPQEEEAKLREPSNNEARQRADQSATRELGDLQARAVAAPVPQAEAPAPAAPASPAASGAAPAPAAAATAERAEADSKKEVAANSDLAPLAAARRAFAPNQIVAADGTTRWRIINGQQVERSTNAGTSWTPATIASTDALSAAAAPSATVCWIVGARGAVYLTTDGTRFIRLPFTEMVDLTSVFATDALTATVSSADGRSWRTSDQGRNVAHRALTGVADFLRRTLGVGS